MPVRGNWFIPRKHERFSKKLLSLWSCRLTLDLQNCYYFKKIYALYTKISSHYRGHFQEARYNTMSLLFCNSFALPAESLIPTLDYSWNFWFCLNINIMSTAVKITPKYLVGTKWTVNSAIPVQMRVWFSMVNERQPTNGYNIYCIYQCSRSPDTPKKRQYMCSVNHPE